MCRYRSGFFLCCYVIFVMCMKECGRGVFMEICDWNEKRLDGCKKLVDYLWFIIFWSIFKIVNIIF